MTTLLEAFGWGHGWYHFLLINATGFAMAHFADWRARNTDALMN